MLEIRINERYATVSRQQGNAQAVKVTSVNSLIHALNSRAMFDTGYLDPHVVRLIRLAHRTLVLAYDPGQIRRVSYRQDAVLSFNIPTPPCLFFFLFDGSSGDALRLLTSAVFCVLSPSINDNTPLYKFPFSNVYATGEVCWGSVSHDNRYRVDSGPTDLINAFWLSHFNSDLDEGKNTLERFAQLDGRESFPVDTLRLNSDCPTVKRQIQALGF